MAPYVLCMYLHATCIARACIATTPHRAIYRLPNLPTPPPVRLLPHYYGRVRPCVCNPRAQQATEVSGVGCDADRQMLSTYSNSTEFAHKLRYFPSFANHVTQRYHDKGSLQSTCALFVLFCTNREIISNGSRFYFSPVPYIS